jgi:hypothetical protein
MPITVQLTDGRAVEFPDGTPQQEMEQALLQVPPMDEAPQPQQAQGGGMRDSIAGALPSLGGMVGSIVGGGIGGAALGGAAGQGYGELIRHAGELPGALADIGRNALSQPVATMKGFLTGATEGATNAGIAGGMQGAVEGVTKAVAVPAGKLIYASAMRPIKAYRDKYGLKKLIDAGYENRVMPTKGGVEKVGKLVGASKAKQEGMAAAYDASGKPPLSVFGAANRGLAPEIARADAAQAATGAGGAASGRIAKQVASVMEGGRTQSATGMMAAKRAADDIADPAYAASRLPGGKPVDPGSKAAIAKGWSKGYRETLNDALGKQFADQGRNTKTMFGVGRMADYAADRPERIADLFSVAAGAASSNGDIGEGLMDALKYRVMFSPRVMAGASFAAPQIGNIARGGDALMGGGIEQGLRDALIRALALQQHEQ